MPFMTTKLNDVSRLVHNGVVYRAVNGIVEVPEDVFRHNVSFPHWDVVTKNVDEEIRSQLASSNAEDDEDDNAGGNGPTVAELREKAKELGIQGAGKMKKDELLAAIEEVSKQTNNE